MKAIHTLPMQALTSAGRIVAAIALTVTVTGCGALTRVEGRIARLEHGTPTPAPRHYGACGTQRLRVVSDPHSARVSGDDLYLPIDFVNTSGVACTISGYPRMLAIATTPNVTAKATHLPGTTTAVVLQHDYAAHAWVLIRNASGHKAAGCQSFTGKGLRIWAPRSPAHAWVIYPFEACPAAGSEVLSVLPVQQGLANPSFFP